jgi:Ala-tRNA(Pro) deacylase
MRFTAEFPTAQDLTEYFAEKQIACEKIAHPALATAKTADELLLNRPGTRLKNLFLRDNYGKRHFLLITTPTKQVDLKVLSKQMALSRLGFASNERLAKYLKVKPGCVSMLALLNDNENKVSLWLDEEIWQGDLFHCHPFDNCQTWLISKSQLLSLLGETGHEPHIINLPEVTHC